MMTGFSANEEWYSLDKNNQVILRVDLFISSTCPFCQKADAFFKTAAKTMPWLAIHTYVINKDIAALETFHQLLVKRQEIDFSVPSIFFCNSRWTGFNDEDTGKQLLQDMMYCRNQIAKDGNISQATSSFLQEKSTANWYETSLIENISLLWFIPLMAILDALNPSTFFISMALLGFLFLLPKEQYRKENGILFLVCVGIVHHLQQVHTPLFYQLIYYLGGIAFALGMLLIAYLLSNGFHQQKTLRMRLFVSFMALSSIVIESYQQLFSPNFSLIFSQWLNAQKLSHTMTTLSELIYQLIYLSCIALMVFISFKISYWLQRRWQKTIAFMKNVSWHYLVFVSLIMMVNPVLFSYGLLSLVIVSLAFVIGGLGYCMKKEQPVYKE